MKYDKDTDYGYSNITIPACEEKDACGMNIEM